MKSIIRSVKLRSEQRIAVSSIENWQICNNRCNVICLGVFFKYFRFFFNRRERFRFHCGEIEDLNIFGKGDSFSDFFRGHFVVVVVVASDASDGVEQWLLL